MRAFQDKDDNLRMAAKDPTRLIPDTLSITAETPIGEAGTTTLYTWNEPGTLTTGPFTPPRWAGGIAAWSMSVSDSDTGWAPAPMTGRSPAIGWLDPAVGGQILESSPHLNRVVVFVDMDGDSTFSAVPDSVLGLPAPAGVDTAAWFLEPWGLVEGIELEPGMSADFIVPIVGDSLVSWSTPPIAVPDSLETAATDSTGLVPADEAPESVEVEQ